MQDPYGYSHMSAMDQSQPINIDGGEYQYSESYQGTSFDMQTIPDTFNETCNYPSMNANTDIQSWDQLIGVDASQKDYSYQDASQEDLSANQTIHSASKQTDESYEFSTRSGPYEEVNAELDYETIIRSKNLYNDPQPQIIRKPMQQNPVVYNQKVTLRFLQPPPVQQGPLIIRQIRPPQPPPQPPLIIRQRPTPARSPSPLILREKPPSIPDPTTPQIITKTLPPLPPPPRSVIVEKLPPLPPKPRDIIIERWLPYEFTQKRKVVVHRADLAKPYPKPKNIIIVYEPVQSRVVRHLERLGVQQEDPNKYSSMYGNALLTTEQLMMQIKELGINVDLSPPQTSNSQQQTLLTTDTSSFNNNAASAQRNSASMSSTTSNNFPAYESLLTQSSSNINYENSHQQQFNLENNYYLSARDDLSNQVRPYGLTSPYIPH